MTCVYERQPEVTVVAGWVLFTSAWTHSWSVLGSYTHWCRFYQQTLIRGTLRKGSAATEGLCTASRICVPVLPATNGSHVAAACLQIVPTPACVQAASQCGVGTHAIHSSQSWKRVWQTTVHVHLAWGSHQPISQIGCVHTHQAVL